MLVQLHWQHKDGSTDMRAQREIGFYGEMAVFLKETREDHPLPEGATWMACTEESKHFVLAAKGGWEVASTMCCDCGFNYGDIECSCCDFYYASR